MRTKFFSLVSLLMTASLILAACGTATPVVQTVIVGGEVQVVTATPGPAPAGPKVVTLNFGVGDVPTIDPALSTDTSSVQITWETHPGLVRQNEETAVNEPGMAESWESRVNDDGTETLTFHLRQNVPWVKYDGSQVVQVMDCQETPAPRMVNANDFYYGIMRTLNPATASDYAYVLGLGIVGAGDYNAGTNEDPASVGVRVIDDYTLEMDFLVPAAYNASIAGLWVAAAQPQWIIEGDDCTEARGDKWTETGFQQSYGPYTLKEWIHDTTLTIVKNPFFPGWDAIPQGKVDEFVFMMLDEDAAFAEYEAGNLDATGAPLSEIDRIKTDPTLSQELVIASIMCTYYYGFNTQAEHTNDARVRRALSMAIDRQSLIDNVTKGGQIPAQWFSRPGLTGSPTPEEYPDLGIVFDADGAKAELQSYLDEKGLTADQVNLTLMFNTSAGHQRIAEAIQQMWTTTLGVNVQLTNQEWAVYLKTLQTKEAIPQIWRLGWCMDYADANNFIKEVFVYGGHENGQTGTGINWGPDPDFEALLARAAAEQDPAARVALYAEAEEYLVDTIAAIAPIYWYTRVTLSKPHLMRTFGTGGQEALEKWDVAQ